MMEFRIQNVVAKIDLKKQIDLVLYASRLPTAKYRPTVFPGMFLKIPGLKPTLLVFSSGKVVCVGATSVEEVEAVARKVKELFNADSIEVRITNIVAYAYYKGGIPFDEVVDNFDNVIYEPETFPAITYRDASSGATFLLFNNGKIICTGLKAVEDVSRAIKALEKRLDSVVKTAKAH